MSGAIRGGSPWMRRAVEVFRVTNPNVCAELEERIPDGMHVALICGGSPRPLGAILVRPPNDQLARIEPGYPTVGGAVAAVLHKASEIVVEDHGTFVVTAEVAS